MTQWPLLDPVILVQPFTIAHGEGVWSHETPMTCPSVSSNHLSPLSGCGQYLNVAFHTVMVTLLYLCGDVEKNPGPPCELSIVDGIALVSGPLFLYCHTLNLNFRHKTGLLYLVVVQ